MDIKKTDIPYEEIYVLGESLLGHFSKIDFENRKFVALFYNNLIPWTQGNIDKIKLLHTEFCYPSKDV